MADFVKKTWACDDVITADDLNRLEGGVEEALECCGDKGYSCTEEWVTLTDESVTTAIEEGDSYAIGNFAYSEPITADTIKVTFNGTEYNNVPVVMRAAPLGTIYIYGAQYSDELQDYDFSAYPFVIASGSGINELDTETAGTYQVKIEALEDVIETSECFDKAVNSTSGVFYIDASQALNPTRNYQSGWHFEKQEIPNVTVNKTYAEIKEAYESGRQCVLRRNGILYYLDSASNIQGGYSFARTYTSKEATTISGSSYTVYSIITNEITIAPDDTVEAYETLGYNAQQD